MLIEQYGMQHFENGNALKSQYQAWQVMDRREYGYAYLSTLSAQHTHPHNEGTQKQPPV